MARSPKDLSKIATAARTVLHIPLDLIDFLPQVRTNSGLSVESINELAASLKEHGQLAPIIVHPVDHDAEGKKSTRFVVTAGHRRVMAARVAGFEKIEAIHEPEHASSTPILQLVENVQREDLSTGEIAKALRAIYDAEGGRVTLDDFAKMIGKSKPWISKRLSTTFPDFSPFAKVLMDSGKVADIEIIQLMNQIDKLGAGRDALVKLEAEIIAGDATRKHVKEFLDEMKSKPASANTPPLAQASTPASGAANDDGDSSGDPEDSDGTRAEGAAPMGPTKPIDPHTAIDTIESRIRNDNPKGARDYVNTLTTSALLQITKLTANDHAEGTRYRNESTDEKLYGLAVHGAAFGGEFNLAAFVNGATKRAHTMPELLRTLEAMRSTSKKIKADK